MSDLIVENGKVLKLSGKIATVEVHKGEQCNGCNACLFKSKNNFFKVKAVNSANAGIGDSVTLTCHKDGTLFASFLVYILPVIFCIIGVVISSFIFKNEVFIALFGLVLLVIGYIIVIVIDKFIAKRNSFGIEITQIITKGENNVSK